MEILRQLRMQHNLKQNDVAKALSISQQVYSNYEKDQRQPPIQTLCALADFFSVSVDYLIGHDTNGETVPEYARLYNALSDYHKGIALAYMRGLLAAEGKEFDPIKKSVILLK